MGNETGTTDARGKVWTKEYDALNRVVKATDPLGNATATAYDFTARTVTVTDPSGVSAVTAADLLGRTTSEKDGHPARGHLRLRSGGQPDPGG
ncbi:MAG: RHS repeat domain-containing protein [Actinomycetota bacterium]